MSTTLASHTSKQQSIDSLDGTERSDRYSAEVEHAMMRAQQRARAFVSQTAPQSTTASPSISPSSTPAKGADLLWTPSFSRNKSNERVKSSLKLRPGLQRANSEPSSKSVHFSTTNLVDVRQFRGTQRPSAVSKKPKFYCPSSGDVSDASADHSIDEDDDDDESEDDDDYTNDRDYDNDDEESTLSYFGRSQSLSSPSLFNQSRQRTSDELKGWTLLTPGFVPHAHGREPGPLRPTCYVETLQLTPSPSKLKVMIYVRNITFRKYVALRFTINNWESFVEAQGTYSTDIRKLDRDAGFDRFDVVIPLNRLPSDQLNASTFKFCIHYVADDTEYWDNNGGKNYEVFLRNSKLTSRRREPNLGRSGTIQGRGSPRQQAGSEPRVAINSLGSGGRYDDDDEYDYRTPFGSSDVMRVAGIPLRSQFETRQRDPFIDRYSFETAYSAAPKSPKEYENVPVFTIENNHVVSDTSDDHSVGAVPPSKVITVPQREPFRAFSPPVADAKSADGNAHAWESESYKDFVSKYCFYTPERKSHSKARDRKKEDSAPVATENSSTRNNEHSIHTQSKKTAA